MINLQIDHRNRSPFVPTYDVPTHDIHRAGLFYRTNMDFPKLIRSFRYAASGLLHVVRNEQNMRVHLVAACLVTFCGWYFSISENEWLVLTICMGSVLALECINTSIERLADRHSTETDQLLKQAKDTSAAAVLVAAMASVVVGCIVFIPKLTAILEK